MKTKINNYILIYDDKCPLCAAYTNVFVKCGILSTEGRKDFSSIDDSILKKIDITRSKNEIPLINTASNKVYYGTDALLELLGTKLKCIKTIGSINLINWLLKHLYKFISYNRKVIVAEKCSANQFDCSPELNYTWRIIFLAVFLFANTLALIPITKYVFANSVFANATVYQVQILHAFLVSSNIFLAFTMKKAQAIEYLGQVNMLATLTVLSFLIVAAINKFIYSSALINNSLFIILIVFIAKEYLRRMKYTGTLKAPYVTVSNIICIISMLVIMVFKK